MKWQDANFSRIGSDIEYSTSEDMFYDIFSYYYEYTKGLVFHMKYRSQKWFYITIDINLQFQIIFGFDEIDAAAYDRFMFIWNTKHKTCHG